MVRQHIWVSGRVHGVGYRVTCAQQARLLGISGWVRNIWDGRVEIVAEGDQDALDVLVEWCHQGPRAARVTGVKVELEPLEHLEGFGIG
jgi:acylphosphatase